MTRVYSYFNEVLITILIISCSLCTYADEIEVQRLTWAGVKIVSADTTVLIDAVGRDLWDGKAPEGLVPVTVETNRRYALITHTHNDHFDVETLKNVLGERGYVICHEAIASYVASRGLRVIPATMYKPVLRGGFVFTAVPAEDGLGAEQVSWIVTKDRKRIFHAGDTLWHGQWNTIGKQYGPFEVAFLPINGAQVSAEPASETPAVMTPAQAIDAALILGAKVVVPIHYGLNDPPHYIEVDEPVLSLEREGKRRKQKTEHLLPGQKLKIND